MIKKYERFQVEQLSKENKNLHFQMKENEKTLETELENLQQSLTRSSSQIEVNIKF